LIALAIAATLVVGCVLTLTRGTAHDLGLNLLAEALGAGLVLVVVERFVERDKRRETDGRRRAALEDLRFPLTELQSWLTRLFLESGTAIAWFPQNPEAKETGLPLETLIDHLPRYLGKIDFAGEGPRPQDRYFIEWARRMFETTVDELDRWERNFAGSAGIFDDDFRNGAESLHSFVRAVRLFLRGMEQYILRECPECPVTAYDGVTELDDSNVNRLVTQLHDFLKFYRAQCEQYRAEIPRFEIIFR
jgi:hypothetical protein